MTSLRAAFVASLAALCSLSATAQEPVFESEVFFRNSIEFTEGRKTVGASAFFVKQDGQLYAITAKHLLGKAMGVTPEVKPSAFDQELVDWALSPNKNNRTYAKVTGIVQPYDNKDVDVIYLKAEPTDRLKDENILTLASEPPKPGMKAWLIGCPYSEGKKCTQTLYPLVFETVAERPDFAAFKLQQAAPNLSGFSGAPIVNSAGEVLAVTFGGGDDLVIGTLLPQTFDATYREQLTDWSPISCGDPPSCLSAGVQIYQMHGDLERAELYANQGCAIGSGIQCASIGHSYTEYGGEFGRDQTKAFQYFQKACSEEKAEPHCASLAAYYVDPAFGEPRAELGLEAATKGCDFGEEEACRLKGLISDSIDKDPRIMCERGNQEACFAVGGAKFYGEHGEEMDREGGLALLITACEANVYEACGFVGVILSYGDGVAQDLTKSIEYLTKGCNEGNVSEACHNLGVLYDDGYELPRNAAKATSFMTKACDLGQQKSCDYLK